MYEGAAGSASATLLGVRRRAWSVVTVVILMLLLLLGPGPDAASPAASAQVPDGETTGQPSDDGLPGAVADDRSAGRAGGGQSGDGTDGTVTDGDSDADADVETGEEVPSSEPDVETGEEVPASEPDVETGEEVPANEPDGAVELDAGGTGSGDVEVGGDTPDQTDGADGDVEGGTPQPAPDVGGGTGADTGSPSGGAGGRQPPVHVARPGGPEEPLTHGGTMGDVDDDRDTRGETSRSPGSPGPAGTGTAGEIGQGPGLGAGWALGDRLEPVPPADIGEAAPGGTSRNGPTVGGATGGSVMGEADGDTDRDASEPARPRPSGVERLVRPDEAGPGLSTARASTSPAEGGSKTLWLVTASLLVILIIAGVGADAARHAAGGHRRRGRAHRR